MEDLATRVRSVLRRTGKTQQYLSERSGVSQPTISGILMGADPRVSTATKLGRAIDALEHEAVEAAAS